MNVKLIYILGFAHSGSTLLDIILGSHSQAISTGELWAFPLWVRENRLCSCGRPVLVCEFWGSVIEELQHKRGIDPGELHPANDLERPSRWRRIQAAWQRLRFSENEARTYANREAELFKAIANVSGKSIIVDSSKMLHRLVKLYDSGLFDIKIIHLVRDGRAALDSARRAAKRRAARGGKVLRRHSNALWIYTGWMLTMLAQMKFLNSLPQGIYHRVAYEKLATRPKETIEELCAFLGIEFESEVLERESPRYVFKQEHHLIGGNRMLQQVKENPETPIEYKANWEKNLSFGDRILYAVLGGPILNARLGIPRVKDTIPS